MAMEESRRALAGLLSPHRVMPGVPSQRQIIKVLYIYIYTAFCCSHFLILSARQINEMTLMCTH